MNEAGFDNVDGDDTGEGEEEAGSEAEEGGDITAYEKQRLQTIRQNKNMLASLKVKDLAASLEASAAQAVAVRTTKKKKKQQLVEVSPGSIRRSQRLSSLKSPKVIDFGASSESGESADSGSEAKGFFSASDGKRPRGRPPKKKEPKKRARKKISLAELDAAEDRKKDKDDEEYEPSENSGSEEFQDDDGVPDEVAQSNSRVSRRQKIPIVRGPISSKSPRKRTMSLNSPSMVVRSGDSDDMYEDDEIALKQALALSMQSSLDSRGESTGKLMDESPRDSATPSTRRPRKKGVALSFGESDIEAFFVSIAGSREGRLSLKHLEKAASSHDFTWTEAELKDMIELFDKDNDGQLNLAEFRQMAQRSNLMESC